MVRKLFVVMFAAAMLFTGSATAFAQTTPVAPAVTGKVQLKQADGTAAPLANAAVEAYSTTQGGKNLTGTTDADGNFNLTGADAGTAYIIAVSAPGSNPDVIADVRAGQPNVVISLAPGNGKKLSPEEINALLKQKDAARIADISAKNERTKATNDLITRSLKEGNDAFNAKNYDVAIVKFDEGYNADTAYLGSAPIFLNNKAVALTVRGTDRYNAAVKSGDKAGREAAKQDLLTAYDAADKSLKLLNGASGPDAGDPKTIQSNKYDALFRRTEALRLLTLTELDLTKTKEAQTAFPEYIAVETDAAKKAKAQLAFADALRKSGDCDAAATEYNKALTTSTDNPDALAGAGLCLFEVGVSTDNKDKQQEGLNTLSRFVEVAPNDHRLKQSVADAITYLKNEAKLAPQKGATKTAGRRGKN